MLTMKGENMEELTTAESMVMKTIWDHPHEMALQEIMKLTNETYGKDWKSQTVSTYVCSCYDGCRKLPMFPGTCVGDPD